MKNPLKIHMYKQTCPQRLWSSLLRDIQKNNKSICQEKFRIAA
ncbi:hypothetical protein [Clostridium sp.]|nr:hypothetical protein [Clostridium sp.]MDR3598752.1 hypothetical protein [Clostridium sp.]